MLDKYTNVLVTGGAGFIGSHLCRELLRLGKKVTVVDNLSTGKAENVPAGARLLVLDITQPAILTQAMEGLDLVFHVAAQPSTRRSVDDPLLDFEPNARGTFNVLRAAKAAGVKRLVYTSSSAVYGNPKRLPIKERHLPAPLAPYGASKLCGELYCRVFDRVYGLPCTCLRPFNVYGPGENPLVSQDEVYQYLKAVLEGQPVIVYGDGNQTRDFVHVQDVVQAHILAAERDDSRGYVLNVGTGVETSINQLVQDIEAVTGQKAIIRHEPWPQGDIAREFGDITLAGKVLGYSPRVNLRQGIEDLFRALKK